MKVKKTNALRILDSKHINYEIREYEYDENHLSGEHIIEQVDLDAEQIYKTLVLKSHNDYLVCCIPVLEEIDLKKLAKQSGHKSVEMIHMKDLLSVTGYIRGGCSPIGMKKLFPTYFQEDMILLDKVAVSGGKRGLQVILDPNDLIAVVNGEYVDVIRK
ncbi:MAG: Cys-tRNA(Pro) deacylase [Erysipelotrichaceae bacterium]|nr:Cys-tRNA(Pro) deacylase [Erysipelotrichaceae bacterium]